MEWTRYEARREIVKDLEALGLLVKVEEHSHNVGACYRCGTYSGTHHKPPVFCQDAAPCQGSP
jgi:valyl-tRNA synthetase